MDNSYLFFDIECANCFNGEGKMCSFGYVLTDADFNILDSQDLVMNPETEFDWYLFSNKMVVLWHIQKIILECNILFLIITKV